MNDATSPQPRTSEPRIRTREEHLQWCKERALREVEAGRTIMAIVSMVSDLAEHPQTAGHHGIALGLRLYGEGKLSTPAQVREWINGFN